MKRPSIQFYPGDWRRDSALQSCSLEARGMWIEMMCLMHDGEPYGHLKVNLKVIDKVNLARMVGCNSDVAEALLVELEGAGVFSRTGNGVVYSRRMVRDEEIREKRGAGGKLGGNPQLVKKRRKVNHKDNLRDNLEVNQTVAIAIEDEDSSQEQGMQGGKVMATTMPPPIDAVIAHGQRIMLPEDECRKFFDHHEARGWVSGKSKIVNWQRAMGTWNTNYRTGAFAPKGTSNGTNPPVRSTLDPKTAARRAIEYERPPELDTL